MKNKMNLYYIQTGVYSKVKTNSLLDMVDLDYMGSSEFEFGNVPKSLERIRKNFDENYTIVPSKYKSPDKRRLFVIANKDNIDEILSELDKLINNYLYPTKEPHYIVEALGLSDSEISNKIYSRKKTNFWCCIQEDIDCIFFLGKHRDIKYFEYALSN